MSVQDNELANLEERIEETKESILRALFAKNPELSRSNDGTKFISEADGGNTEMECNVKNVQDYINGRAFTNYKLNKDDSNFHQYEKHHIIVHDSHNMFCLLSNTYKKRDHKELQDYIKSKAYAK